MTRLLVLWILSERTSYGYEIKKALSDDAMDVWFGLDDASIYSALRTLTKHGHTKEIGTEQVGGRPTRTRYAITAAGRRYYRQLLLESMATPKLPVAAIDVALAAQGDLDPAAVSDALAQRAKALDEMAATMERARRGAPSVAIPDRNLAIIEAEQTWLATLDHATIV